VDPSIRGTENVLGSITKAGCVKRIVHTSSIAAIMNAELPGRNFSEEDWNTWSTIDNGDPYVRTDCPHSFSSAVLHTPVSHVSI
jgi:nucleoside-diphosphate-sugar epimerase